MCAHLFANSVFPTRHRAMSSLSSSMKCYLVARLIMSMVDLVTDFLQVKLLLLHYCRIECLQ